MMPDNGNGVNAYVLAGGKSSRMGSDKGLMLFNGKPMIKLFMQKNQRFV